MLKNRSEFLVAVGSNLGFGIVDVTETVLAALNRLSRENCVIRAESRLFETPCFPVGAGPDFVNAAVRFEADWTAQECLERLHAIEQEFGRQRQQRWGPRSLDLDLIAAGDLILPDIETYEQWAQLAPDEQSRQSPDQLIVPHPRAHERAFVLVPLADIAPDWIHPVRHKTVNEMLNALPESEIQSVKPLVL